MYKLLGNIVHLLYMPYSFLDLKKMQFGELVLQDIDSDDRKLGERKKLQSTLDALSI